MTRASTIDDSRTPVNQVPSERLTYSIPNYRINNAPLPLAHPKTSALIARVRRSVSTTSKIKDMVFCMAINLVSSVELRAPSFPKYALYRHTTAIMLDMEVSGLEFY